MKTRIAMALVLCLALVACGDDDNAHQDTTVKTGIWSLIRIEQDPSCRPLASAAIDTIKFSFAICEGDIFETLEGEDACQSIDGNTYSWDCTTVNDNGTCVITEHSVGMVKVSENSYSGTDTLERSMSGGNCESPTGELCTVEATIEAVWVRALEEGDCDQPAPAAVHKLLGLR